MKFVSLAAQVLLPASLLVGCATTGSTGSSPASAATSASSHPAAAASTGASQGGARGGAGCCVGEGAGQKATSGVMPVHQRSEDGQTRQIAPKVSSSLPEGYGPPALHPREVRLKNLRQLTFGGENAEAYFSFDGQRLSFQATRDGAGCDRIYTMRIDGSDLQAVSSGEGGTTCAYYTPDGKSVIYASTHLAGPECPPRPDMSQGYVWALHASYDIFKKNLETSEIVRLTDTPGYDAEATISPDGKRIVFTSVRDGDIELYSMDLDGKNVTRLTHTPGYDGGAFYSHDSKQLVWRASRPSGDALVEFQKLLAQGLVRPSKLDLFVANADGSQARQLTHKNVASFGPYFLPDDSGVIFSSNMADGQGRNFDLFVVPVAGGEPEQVTFDPSFDGFPMFSRDGKTLVFASNRNGRARGETNLFMADWVP